MYQDWQFHREYFTSVSWTSPVTSRLLLDARFANHGEGFVDKYPEPGGPVPPSNSGARTEHGIPLSRQGLRLSALLLVWHAGGAAYRPGACVRVVFHGVACVEVRLSKTNFGGVPRKTSTTSMASGNYFNNGVPTQNRATRAAVRANNRCASGYGHICAGQMDIQARDDQTQEFGSTTSRAASQSNTSGQRRSCPTGTSRFPPLTTTT
jgi:hypothetical protein